MTVAEVERIGAPEITRDDARKAFLEYRLLTGAGVYLRCLRKSQDGHPWHPLYVPYATMPITYADAR